MNDVQVLGRVGGRRGQVLGRVGRVFARFGFVVAIGLLAGGLSTCRRNVVDQVPPAGDSSDSGISANSESASAESGDEQDSETQADSVLRSTDRDDAGGGQVPDGLQFRLDDLENQIAAANRRIDDELTRGGRAVDRFGVLVTVLLVGLGLFSFFSASRKVEQEAKQWFEEHSDNLQEKVAEVIQLAQEAGQVIDQQKIGFGQHVSKGDCQ